ncbi:hypothetical protein Strain138_002817 [Pseudogemmatithrix spongiicola]|uniref:DUF3575 domain-containing protein n=1 Tax=Pseudogemmatithrix spongiicola TaxID=3062599 RepID=A0AA49K2H3_9BACT|nr:hypothetical protein Strain138_002817 [Gemmatimonadaceae bacterium 'strain 138']WKW16401.1 hypothetical protein Strain318_002817 [Gemmatimonadaceae bacterium 'strain 318']
MRIAVPVIAVLLALTAARAPLAAQEPGRTVAYLELLGSGGPWSMNLERAIGSWRMRGGFASWSTSDFWSDVSTSYTTVPVTLSRVLGDGNHRLEIGGGVTLGGRSGGSSSSGIFASEESSRFVTLTGIFGYRYQKPGRGFVFRAGLIPLYGLGSPEIAYPDKGLLPSIGLSFGAAF